MNVTTFEIDNLGEVVGTLEKDTACEVYGGDSLPPLLGLRHDQKKIMLTPGTVTPHDQPTSKRPKSRLT